MTVTENETNETTTTERAVTAFPARVLAKDRKKDPTQEKSIQIERTTDGTLTAAYGRGDGTLVASLTADETREFLDQLNELWIGADVYEWQKRTSAAQAPKVDRDGVSSAEVIRFPSTVTTENEEPADER